MAQNILLETLLRDYWNFEDTISSFYYLTKPYSAPPEQQSLVFLIRALPARLKVDLTEEFAYKEFGELVKDAYLAQVIQETGLSRGKHDQKEEQPGNYVYTQELHSGAVFSFDLDLRKNYLEIRVQTQDLPLRDRIMKITSEYLEKTLRLPRNEPPTVESIHGY